MNKQEIFAAALKYRAAGLEVIPDHPIKKHPYGIEGWQEKEFTEEDLRDKIFNYGWGIGIRNSEIIDFDNHNKGEAKETLEAWIELVNKLSPGLFGKLVIEKTQHNGYHLGWKCSVIEGAQKLANRPPTEEEAKDPKVKSVSFIETRGTGSQFVAAPTPGYKLLKGDWSNLQTITPGERKILIDCARVFNLIADKPDIPHVATETLAGDRPGDVYDKKDGITETPEILKEYGWTEAYRKGEKICFRRPGKSEGSISATYGHIAPGVFYNFSSNGSPFELNTSYTPFQVFALLKHNEDFHAAASELAKRYGMQKNQEPNESIWRFTDTSNAEKISDLFGDKTRFDHRRKRWLIWQGHRWQPDTDGSINRIAIETSRKRYQEATAIEDLAQRGVASKWAIQSESKMRLDAATTIAKSLKPIADRGDNWDADSMLLSCPNGIIDLKTGSLRGGKPEDRITMSINANYDLQADCPLWKKFISEIFEDNQELIRFIHKSLGYTITGSTKEQVAFFCFGSGSNGKSVLFKTVNGVLGDYAYDAPVSLLQRNVNNTNSNDVAATEFKRFLVSSETLSTSKLNEQRIKGWTGGDTVTARYLYGEYFSFEPTVKPWLFINHRPLVEDDSYGFWRRVRLIPFNRIFKPEEQDKDLVKKLRGEYSGILNWLIEGCLLWQMEGLEPTPDLVTIATQSYRQENDELAEFIVNKCEEGSDKKARASKLYKAYTQWAGEDQGLKDKEILKSTAFGRRMTDKFNKKRDNKGAYYEGISLISVGFDGENVPECRVDPHFHETPLVNSRVDSLMKTTPNPSLMPKIDQNPSLNDSQPETEVCQQCNGTTFYKNPSGILTCSRCHPPVEEVANDQPPY